MALASTGVIEVRSDGSANNAGYFNPLGSSPGTDRSMQATAQTAYTDLVIGASNTVTSVLHPFTSADNRNGLRITGGTGFTVGVYEIISVVGVVATLDRSPGTLASTGGTGNLGGALLTLAGAALIAVAGATVYIKATGGYTTAATITLSVDAGDGTPVTYAGYTTTRGDNGQAVITCTNAAATSVLNITGAGSVIKNLTVDGAGLALRCFNTADFNITLDNCWAKGATQYGFRATSSTAVHFRRCLATGNGTSGNHAGFVSDTTLNFYDRCVARDNAGNGFSALTLGEVWAVNCIAHGNSLSGFLSSDGALRLVNCTSYGNTLDGVRFAAASSWGGSIFRDCIFAANGGYGMRSITTDYSGTAAWIVNLENNAFYGNTLGARFQVPTGAADITLTADPFADAASDDFALNMIEGGGLELRAAGVPGGFGLLSSPEPSVGTSDVGAVPSGGATSSSTGLGTMRGLWYELVGEKDTSVVPFTVCDMYLQRGLEELNRLTRYHYTDDATSITLVAGTQEYALPAACNQLIFVTWRGQELKKSSVDQWRSQGEPWQQQTGEPREWAMYGEKLVIFPTPTTEAVAADPNPVLRYGSNPPDIGTSGPEQLRAQDYPIPVYHGVALWSASYPDSGSAQLRLGFYEPLFDKEAGKVGAYYEARSVTR